jgi:isochorismate synthase
MLDFILYSLPNQVDFYHIYSSEEKEIKFTASFFDNSHIFSIEGKKESVCLDDFDFGKLYHELDVLNEDDTVSKEEYEEKIQKCIREIQIKNFKKIVLSRRKKEFYKINSLETLKKIRKEFPATFVYLFKYKKEVWLGATPELLASWNDSNFKTIALAGTKKDDENFSQKEFEEQQHVTDFIYSIIKNYDSQVVISKVNEQKFGTIKHLITNFKATCSKELFFDVIEKLHPTPAVCGLPQNESFRFILENESQNRLFYTGKMIIEEKNSILAFVNLRCLKFYQNGFEIFVGGGITNQSTSENEWDETELKAKNILTHLEIL